jgi:hypothetical protein
VAFHRSFAWGSALLVGALFVAVACGGRDQLSFGDEGFGGDGFGGDGFGGDDPVGPGQGGFISQGGGGFGPTTNVTVTTTVTTGVGGAPATSTGVGASGPSSSSVTVSSGVTTIATTVATTATTVATTATTTVTTATSGVGGMGPSSSVVTVSGSGPVTSGGPLDCFACIQGNCPQAQACLQNPTCLQGTICAVTQCLGGPPDFGCVLNCFNGDFMAAFQALQAVTCIFQQCGQQCQGLFGP